MTTEKDSTTWRKQMYLKFRYHEQGCTSLVYVCR